MKKITQDRVKEILIQEDLPTDEMSIVNYSLIYAIAQRDLLKEQLEENK